MKAWCDICEAEFQEGHETTDKHRKAVWWWESENNCRLESVSVQACSWAEQSKASSHSPAPTATRKDDKETTDPEGGKGGGGITY